MVFNAIGKVQASVLTYTLVNHLIICPPLLVKSVLHGPYMKNN